MISGVAQVQVLGAQKYAVHVQLDPRALAYRQLGIDEVSAAVQNGNVTLYGVVLNQGDKDAAGIRANSVPGVFKVTNDLQVANQPQEK